MEGGLGGAKRCSGISKGGGVGKGSRRIVFSTGIGVSKSSYSGNVDDELKNTRKNI